MNILDPGMWPEGPAPDANIVTWSALFGRRRRTFEGFCETERTKGVLSVPTNLATPKGQEMARLLMFRTLEELVEALDSVTRDHILEELIDSINYAMSLLLIDPNVGVDGEILESLASHRNWRPRIDEDPSKPVLLNIGWATASLARVTDLFRNRAWMVNSQDVYFAGARDLAFAVGEVIHMMLHFFESFDEFWHFFVAKDNVLQFRLRTQY